VLIYAIQFAHKYSSVQPGSRNSQHQTRPRPAHCHVSKEK